jgi:hypothetical protein
LVPTGRPVVAVVSSAGHTEYPPCSAQHVSISVIMLRALDLALASMAFPRWPRNAGSAIAARIPMMRMTTSSSMRVKPLSSVKFL